MSNPRLGRNVIIEQPYSGPQITQDGVTVAKSIALKDKFENLGARLIEDVASKTNEVAGDGATVLARTIYSEGVKTVAAGCNPMDLRRGSQATVDRVVAFLPRTPKPSRPPQKSPKSLPSPQTATCMRSRSQKACSLPYFITDVEAQKVEFEKPLIFLKPEREEDQPVAGHPPSLEAAARCSSSQRTLTAKPSQPVSSIPQQAARAGQRSSRHGLRIRRQPQEHPRRPRHPHRGTIFTDELEVKLERATLDMLGSTGSITITKDNTSIVNGDGSKDAISVRTSPSCRNDLRSSAGVWRSSKLGGASEVEVGEKDRYDDVFDATSAAVEGGILPCGGVTYLKASLQLATTSPSASASSTFSPTSLNAPLILTANFDKKLGVATPIRTILDNAGEESSVIIGALLTTYASEDKFRWGYDVPKGEYVDIVERGIVPLKVVRTALVDAAGVTSLLTTSEACVVEVVAEAG
ncbi:GroEL equatorial domain-like protein [Coprinopsis marcescibilis]|uniref:GroEL equatorial domain-like protein n=1 Tax=Coprinopsis marcescibilis TaxID=230819 RepID=A0A5C3KAT6_COPMA|nr:GroEL equatorial domain-like protein [Coprinopsis marcescibilis]